MNKIELMIEDIISIIKILALFLLASIILAFLLTLIDQYVDTGASIVAREKIFLLNFLFSCITIYIVVKNVDSMAAWPYWLKLSILESTKYESLFYIVMSSFLMSCIFYIVKYYLISLSGLIYSNKEMTIMYDFIAILLIPSSILIYIMFILWMLKKSHQKR